jgi:hypothetical protein
MTNVVRNVHGFLRMLYALYVATISISNGQENTCTKHQGVKQAASLHGTASVRFLFPSYQDLHTGRHREDISIIIIIVGKQVAFLIDPVPWPQAWPPTSTLQPSPKILMQAASDNCETSWPADNTCKALLFPPRLII